MIYNTIKSEISEGVCTITLNRPEIHNAFNDVMITEISDCIDSVEKDDNVRIILFRGNGKSFCAGADLNWLGGVKDFSYEENYEDSLNIANCFHKIYSSSKVTIAVVHGASIGGANGIVTSCDIVICEKESKFSLSEVKIGIVPACIAPYLYKRCGEYNSLELMLSGKRISGIMAEKYNLANKSIDKEDIDDYVGMLINDLLKSHSK